MRPPTKFEAVIDRKRYNVETATLLAGDDHWDGHNFERSGRNTWLYRTPKGSYFSVTLSQWQGEREGLVPLSLDDAISTFEAMSEHRVEYAEAFPGVTVSEA